MQSLGGKLYCKQNPGSGELKEMDKRNHICFMHPTRGSKVCTRFLALHSPVYITRLRATTGASLRVLAELCQTNRLWKLEMLEESSKYILCNEQETSESARV